jgi:hypothetical protein
LIGVGEAFEIEGVGKSGKVVEWQSGR